MFEGFRQLLVFVAEGRYEAEFWEVAERECNWVGSL